MIDLRAGFVLWPWQREAEVMTMALPLVRHLFVARVAVDGMSSASAIFVLPSGRRIAARVAHPVALR
jgi:hypothetical protein